MRSEIHPLDALLANEKLISEEAAVPYVSSEVVGMVEKDRAPIPEVTTPSILVAKLEAVYCVKCSDIVAVGGIIILLFHAFIQIYTGPVRKRAGVRGTVSTGK